MLEFTEIGEVAREKTPGSTWKEGKELFAYMFLLENGGDRPCAYWHFNHMFVKMSKKWKSVKDLFLGIHKPLTSIMFC